MLQAAMTVVFPSHMTSGKEGVFIRLAVVSFSIYMLTSLKLAGANLMFYNIKVPFSCCSS